jgi:hypothetical protein
MGPVQRGIRRAINPISTALTRWWLGMGRRRVPAPAAAGPRPEPTQFRPRAFRGVASPGDWAVPSGLRPGWQWLPEYGAHPNLRAMPRWVRLWYRTPFIDRYAYEWMWWHGGWSVLVPADESCPPAD